MVGRARTLFLFHTLFFPSFRWPCILFQFIKAISNVMKRTRVDTIDGSRAYIDNMSVIREMGRRFRKTQKQHCFVCYKLNTFFLRTTNDVEMICFLFIQAFPRKRDRAKEKDHSRYALNTK